MALTPIQAVVLQGLLGQLSEQTASPLQEGAILPGRVVVGPDGQPMLLLAGVRMPAQLPEGLPIGQPLKLRVDEASAERITLRLVDAPAPAQPQAVSIQAQIPWTAIPMPSGAQVRVWVDPPLGEGEEPVAGASGERAHAMIVRYDSQTLGRVDVVLRLGADQLSAAVLAPPGDPLSALRESLPQLRTALIAATGRSVAITTGGRSDDVDVRA